MTTVLQVRNLVTRFSTLEGLVHAVNGVSFDLNEGETLAIVGESGSGKSVTMLSLLRMIPEPPGRIEGGEARFFDGGTVQDLLQLSPAEIRQIRGRKVGFIFQDPLTSLNPVLTIGQQVAEVLVEHLGLSNEQARERAISLLERVGIPGAGARYNNYPHQFSGGMRQRVMIAMAIACSPQIVIADEPTTALDVTIQAQIVDLIKQLQSELNVAAIWITHDLGVVAGIADRVVVMYGGMVMEQGLVDDLYEHPQHPYTIGLLGALPRLNEKEEKRLVSIKGTPPDLLVKPSHCQFAWRCPHAFDRCWQETPSLIPVGEQHLTACFFDGDNGRPRNDA
ncbi:MAG: ABC transporter ATP-binding protein [Anaerolineales bacterium]